MIPSSMSSPVASQPPGTPSMVKSRRTALVIGHWKIALNFLLLLVAAFFYTELIRLLSAIIPFTTPSPFPPLPLTFQDFLLALWNAYYHYFRYAFFGFYIVLLVYAILKWRSRFFHRGNVTLLGIVAGFTFVPIFMWFVHRLETQTQMVTAPYVFAPYLLGHLDVPGLDIWFPWATAAVFVGSCGMIGRYLYGFWATTSEPTTKRWDDWLWEIGGTLLLMGIFSAASPIHTTQLNQPLQNNGIFVNLSSVSLVPLAESDKQRAIIELQLVNESTERISLNSSETIILYAFQLMDQHGASFDGNVFTYYPGQVEPYRGDALPFYMNGNGERMRLWLMYDLPRTSFPMALYHDSSQSDGERPYIIRLTSPTAPVSLPPAPTIEATTPADMPVDLEIPDQFSGTHAQTIELEESRFVAIQVRFTHKATRQPVPVLGAFNLFDTDGFVYQSSALVHEIPFPEGAPSNFRETGEGWVAFVVPRNVTLAHLRFEGSYNEQDIEIIVPFTEH